MNDSPLTSQQAEAPSHGHPDLNSLIETIREAASLPPAQRKSFRIHGSGSHDFVGESLEGELLETRGLSESSLLVRARLYLTWKIHWQKKGSAWHLSRHIFNRQTKWLKPLLVAWLPQV